jgi:hypothetical protein
MSGDGTLEPDPEPDLSPLVPTNDHGRFGSPPPNAAEMTPSPTSPPASPPAKDDKNTEDSLFSDAQPRNLADSFAYMQGCSSGSSELASDCECEKVEESAASKNADFAKSFYDNPVDAERESAIIANLIEEEEDLRLSQHSVFVKDFYKKETICVSPSPSDLDDALAEALAAAVYEPEDAAAEEEPEDAAAEDEPEDSVREQAVSPMPSEWIPNKKARREE